MGSELFVLESVFDIVWLLMFAAEVTTATDCVLVACVK